VIPVVVGSSPISHPKMLTEIKDLTVLDFFSLSYCIITICQQRDDAARCPVFALLRNRTMGRLGQGLFPDRFVVLCSLDSCSTLERQQRPQHGRRTFLKQRGFLWRASFRRVKDVSDVTIMATLGKAVGIKRVEVTHKPVAKRVARSTT
jgi:hypothetical protein